MGQGRETLSVRDQDESAGDSDHSLHWSHDFVVDHGTRQDLGVGSIDSPGEEQAVASDNQDPFPGLVKIEVATAVGLGTVDPIENPATERKRNGLDGSFPHRPWPH